MKAGKIIKKIFALLFIIFFAFLLIRIFLLTESRTLKDIYPTDNAREAYEEGLLIKSFGVKGEISTDGYYKAYGATYCEETGELQLTVKYNDSLTEKYLAGAEKEDFVWSITDYDGNVISCGEPVDYAEKYSYNFIKIVFENCKVSEGDTLLLKLSAESVGYPAEDGNPYLILATDTTKYKTYRLSEKEKESLK